MKYTKMLYGLAAASMLLTACDDDLMKWRDPDSSVRPEELPLELREKIDRYDFLKNYMEEYRPGVDITVGMGLDNFLSTEIYEQTVLDNFQGCTFGNALKHQSVVQNNGSYNWNTIDRFIQKNTGLRVHGHNFIWHTQQNQSYLKSLIAPEMVFSGDTDNDIMNRLVGDESNFDGGTKGGWGSWGGDSESSVSEPGRGGAGYCMKLTNYDEGEFYQAQAGLTFAEYLKPDTYKVRFYAKTDAAGGQLQFQHQNSSNYGSQGAYQSFDIGSDWTLCEHEFNLTYDDVDRILINFGKVPGNYYIDDIEFGVKNENAGGPSDPMINVIPATSSNFDGVTDGSTPGWMSWGSNKESVETVEGAGPDGSVAAVLKSKADANMWEAQFVYEFNEPFEVGVTYVISFDAKSDNNGGVMQFQYQNSDNGNQGGYHDFEIGTSWIPCEYEFSITNEEYIDVNRIILNFGKVGATYTVDNIKFGPKIDQAKKPRRFTTRASSVYYVLKTPEEKKQLLLGAMEDWIKEAMNHVGKYCTSYDVINEPIGDDATFRGINGRGWMSGDSEPVETVETGLNLNWENGAGNGHFYWGYYLGMDYAVKAFEYARKYAAAVNPDMKLFVNDYNLEVSPNKLKKLIEFVEYIDQNGAHVDGIGTQMHVNGKSITKEQVDEMFKTLAATGKLIRITELDVALGTAAPSVEEQQIQSDVYQMIITSYFENIPQAQQSGVTIWSLTDNAKEHEYWLNGDTPNIFDAEYRRKIAYKGVADAIIGFDPSGDWESPDYSKTASE